MFTTFRSTACSLKLFMNVAFRGSCPAGVLVISGSEIEYLAFCATTNELHHDINSVLGGDSAATQKVGNPLKADNPQIAAFSPKFDEPRSRLSSY